MRIDGITFIIPNWNHELVLPRSIRSALRCAEHLDAHGLGVEVLVVDDASRDGSSVLLRQLEALYYDQGLRVLALESNKGPAAARNAALAAARYRYVVFMDADNEILPANLHLFYRAIRETDAAIIYGNIVVHDRDGVNLVSHESFQTRIYQENYIDTFSLCDAVQLIDARAFWPDHRTPREDWELYLHMATCGRRLIHVPIAFGLYYCNRLSRIDEARSTEVVGSDLKLFQRIFRQFPEIRDEFHSNSLHLRYHPDLGYL